MAIEITMNAISKVRELKNLKGNSAKKLIGRAYVCGTDIRDLSSRERAYYECHVDISKREAFVYAGCCFIFAGNYCINVIKSPTGLLQKSRYDGKLWVKNPKKYIRHYDSYMHSECA